MAKVKFKTNPNNVIKARFVTKRTFKWLILSQVTTLMILGGCIARLYYLRDLDQLIAKTQVFLTSLTTYYTIIESFIKGLF